MRVTLAVSDSTHACITSLSTGQVLLVGAIGAQALSPHAKAHLRGPAGQNYRSAHAQKRWSSIIIACCVQSLPSTNRCPLASAIDFIATKSKAQACCFCTRRQCRHQRVQDSTASRHGIRMSSHAAQPQCLLQDLAPGAHMRMLLGYFA